MGVYIITYNKVSLPLVKEHEKLEPLLNSYFIYTYTRRSYKTHDCIYKFGL